MAPRTGQKERPTKLRTTDSAFVSIHEYGFSIFGSNRPFLSGRCKSKEPLHTRPAC